MIQIYQALQFNLHYQTRKEIYLDTASGSTGDFLRSDPKDTH